MDSHPYDWRVDKYEPNRVWWTVRNTATHTGPLTFFGSTYKPTGKVRGDNYLIHKFFGSPPANWECIQIVGNHETANGVWGCPIGRLSCCWSYQDSFHVFTSDQHLCIQ